MLDLPAAALLALSCLDLTSLNALDTEDDIARLCQRAQGRFGLVAAVCVWPRLAAFARQHLPDAISVAAVVNFPEGGGDVEQAVRDTGLIVQSGAQEVDVVLPYRHLMAGDNAPVAAVLGAVRKASAGLRLKVILETGQLQHPALISQACRMALDAGADFLKTSTGKTQVSATPDAARLLLQAIARHPQRAHRVGFKPSGGIRTVRDAMVYMALTAQVLGPEALQAQRFRIGASSILDDIEAVLGGTSVAPTALPGSY
ncbi:MAG: deoxyribose-phosphate aldolase [Burkholderiales bacterium PBB4]|nr:MAG: deoxyribose-phosphate aldolase [Burkholderiales bacterium PBB4]